MKLVEELGIKGTGSIDKRYGTERTATYALFECPVCKEIYERIKYKGMSQSTCVSCRGSQNVTHGMSSTRQYKIWQGMRDRCGNSKNVKYNIYGGVGITVCERWSKFENFWEDMKKNYSDDMTIDRIDSNKNYCKENCQWLSKSDNSAKTSRSKPVSQWSVAGKEKECFELIKTWDSAKQAADKLGLTPAHITIVCKGKRKTHGGYGWKYVK